MNNNLHKDIFSGSCKNSSPAGKRRIALGLMETEQMFQLSKDSDKIFFGSYLNSLPSITIAGVIIIIIVFVTVFAALKVRISC